MSNNLPRADSSGLLSSQAVLDILKLIFAGAPLRDVLNIVAQLVEAQREGMLCAIWFLDQDGKHFYCGAAPSLPREYITKVDGVAATPNGTSCGAAVYRREPVYVTDILSDPLWDDYRDLASAYGLRACWSHPLRSSEGRILGTFANYYRETRSPTPADVSLIENATHIAGIAIERQVKEHQLRQSELNLRRMTETIPEMLWSATPDGAIDYCNARLIDYTGVSAEDVMGEGWMKLIHPDDVEPTLRKWKSSVAGGVAYSNEVRTIHAADGAYRWCVTNALPLRDERGQIVKWHGTVVDMHDWKHSQEALRNTQAELANVTRIMTMIALTASIAHEVNQPLSGIITNAGTCLRMLDADPPNIDGARETARRTIRDGNRASQVIARLRALFTNKSTATESVDLNEAAREVIALLAAGIQRTHVVLRRELADGLPLLAGDRIQLQQVILNLLQNALDAVAGIDGRPRQLLIKTECEGDRVCLTVRDNGGGFNPQEVSRLFDPFFTTKAGGMGIGLAVSRSIVESHDGRLGATLNEDHGATFSFSIPSQGRHPGVAVDVQQGCSPTAVTKAGAASLDPVARNA